MKYWSQLGRNLCSFVRSSFPSVAYRCGRFEDVFSSLIVALAMRGWRPWMGPKRCSSDLKRNSSRVGLGKGVILGELPFWRGWVALNLSRRVWKRFQRTLTGASTLTRMKNGRRRSLSRIASVCMSVITHLFLHCLVTKSIKSSAWVKLSFSAVDSGEVRRSLSNGTSPLDSGSDLPVPSFSAR